MQIKKLNVNQLKYIAAFFMLLDSLYLAFPDVFPAYFHLMSRFAAPLFAFFLTEGFFHTRNRKKYFLRLWLAAGLMLFGNLLSVPLLKNYRIRNNIFLTLALGFSMICVLEAGKKAEGKKKAVLYAAAFLIYAGGSVLGFEGGVYVLSVIGIFYLFYGNRRKQVLAFLIWNFLFILLTGFPLPWRYESGAAWFQALCRKENLAFLFLPFLLLYNGEKGERSPFHRYFFYVFYPAHLWLIHGLAALLGR